MKMFGVFLLFVQILIFASGPALAGGIEGRVQGYNCAAYGKGCATSATDPAAAAERVFVVRVKSGEFYFLTNVERSLLAGYLQRRVRVTGVVDAERNTVIAESVAACNRGDWQVVWSAGLEEDWADKLGVATIGM